MPQHRQINFSLRKCSLPFFPTVFETTSGSFSDPWVRDLPSLIYSMSTKFRENNAKILRCYILEVFKLPCNVHAVNF